MLGLCTVSLVTDNTTLTRILFTPRYSFDSWSRAVCCLHCALNLTATENELLKALGSVTNEPFNLSHHAAYIWLALQMENGREMAADARSTQYQHPTAGHKSIRRVSESP